MANIPLKTIKFPGLDDTYTFLQNDDTLTVSGAAADAKKTGDEIAEIKEAISSGVSIMVDSELDSESSNPVENRVVTVALGTKGTYSKPAGGIPRADFTSDVQSSLGKADTALQSAPVTSVNGQTGDVTVQAATDQQVADAASSWLAANIDPATGYVIDSSLSVSGAAADAAAVGNYIVTHYENTKIKLPYAFKSGGINNSTGVKTTNNKRAYTDMLKLQKGAKYTIKSGFEFVAYEYGVNANHTPKYIGVKITAYVTEYTATDNAIVVFVVRNTSDTTISDLTAIEMYISSDNDFLVEDRIGYGILRNIAETVIGNTVLVGSTGTVTSNSNYSTTDYVEVNPGDVLCISATCGGVEDSNNYTGLYTYDSAKTLIQCLVRPYTYFDGMNKYVGFGFDDSVLVLQYYRVVVPAGVKYVRLSSRTSGRNAQAPAIYRGSGGAETKETGASAGFKTIMHRGYNSVAPENTIPAFKLARQMGFDTIETDVQLTSDSVPVILHDATVNRTSNGTGNIYGMTLAQAKALDFGSWKGAEWAGTTIPTFEEMLLCCRNIGLDVYIEVKQESPWTQALITSCVETVRRCGMKDHVTWISFSATILGYVKTADGKARLGFLMTTYTTGAVDTCVSLCNGENSVAAVTRYDLLSSSVLDYMISKDIPLVAYMFDTTTAADAMPSYATAALSNTFDVSKYVFNQNIDY